MTDDWTAGYVADIGYTYGYYPELNPLRARLALLHAGLACPTFENACELGFGQGLSVNLHAAASGVHWAGTDFNPAQAAFAQELAAASGSGARLFDQSFEELAARTDLPEFDYIGLHGIWSWISDANRAVIVDFVRRRLKVGGVLYVSYNTLPGWAAFAPMRHLLTQHAESLGNPGSGLQARIDGALQFSEQLMACNPTYSKANPQVKDRLQRLKTQSRNYLAHEYFNRDWHPMHFATMAQWLAPAKLQFACSAHLSELVEQINLSPEQSEFLKGIPDPMFRESVKDFMVNQQFRRDYWVRGARVLTPVQRKRQLLEQRVVLTSPVAEVPQKVTSALGEATLREEVRRPVLEALADHKVATLAELTARARVSLAQAMEVLLVLGAAGHVVPARSESQVSESLARTRSLNRHLCERAHEGAEVGYLASSVTGGGVAVSRFHQLFMGAIARGHAQPGEWAQGAWTALQQQGQRLMVAGKPLEDPQENLRELERQAAEFQLSRLPILNALGVEVA